MVMSWIECNCFLMSFIILYLIWFLIFVYYCIFIANHLSMLIIFCTVLASFLVCHANKAYLNLRERGDSRVKMRVVLKRNWTHNAAAVQNQIIRTEKNILLLLCRHGWTFYLCLFSITSESTVTFVMLKELFCHWLCVCEVSLTVSLDRNITSRI